MPHTQATASAATLGTQLPLMWDRITAVATAMPLGSVAAAVLLVLVALLVYLRLIRKTSAAVLTGTTPLSKTAGAGERMMSPGPFAVLGVCGMAVSLYGLYGFATGTAKLPTALALPFVAIFDVAEAACFRSLYQSAARSPRWTAPMRKTRRMAWGLVMASAAMNWAHAPNNWVAQAVLAAVPVVSATLIEHELDKQLADNADEDEEDARPGPVRLIRLAYVHGWARLFARLGLDAAGRDGQVSRKALIRRASRQIHMLRQALDQEEAANKAQEAKPRQRTRVANAVQRAEERAQLAIDTAGLAGDPAAQLLTAQGLVTRGRVKDLARLPVDRPLEIAAMLEELAIMPSAEAIEAGARATQAEQRRVEAEQAVQEAQEAREEAEKGTAVAQKAQKQAETEAAELAAQVIQAQQDQKEAEKATQEAHKRAAQVTSEISKLQGRADELRESTGSAGEWYKAVNERLTEARRELVEVQEEADRFRTAAKEARAQEEQATAAQSAAADRIEKAEGAVRELSERADELRRTADELARQRDEHLDEIARLAAERQRHEEEVKAGVNRVKKVQEETQEAENLRQAAHTALRRVPDELMEALTNPAPYVEPRWTSDAKRCGWELFMTTIERTGEEPSDDELARACDRDPSTARKWLTVFRSEYARRVAAALPAEADAHDRTTAAVAQLAAV